MTEPEKQNLESIWDRWRKISVTENPAIAEAIIDIAYLCALVVRLEDEKKDLQAKLETARNKARAWLAEPEEPEDEPA